MMEEVIVQESVAETVAANVEPAKEVLLGMTTPQIIVFGAGIVFGGVCCYAGYKCYKNKISADKSENLFKEKKKLKSIRELVSRQEHVSTLDSANLREWFKKNHVEIENAKLMLAIPSDKVLNAVGYTLDDDKVDLDKFIIQSIYDSKNGMIYKWRFITFDSIESSLQAKLLENNGLVILDT